MMMTCASACSVRPARLMVKTISRIPGSGRALVLVPIDGRPYAGTAVSSARQLPGAQSKVINASISSRVLRIGRGDVRYRVDKAVSALENPQKLLRQIAEDIESDLAKIQSARAEVTAARIPLERKYTAAVRAAEEWYSRAELAVKRGDDALARLALERRKVFQDQAAALEPQLRQQLKAEKSLKASAALFNNKMLEARSKIETLRMRAQAAEAKLQLGRWLQDTVGDLRSSAGTAVAALERMENKVLAMEAEAEIASQALRDPMEDRWTSPSSRDVDWELLELRSNLQTEGRLPSSRRLASDSFLFGS